MAGVFGGGLLFPALFLALMGWLVPKLLSMVIPEGVKPLMLLGVVSTVFMLIITSVLFLGLYIIQGASIATLTSSGYGDAAVFFMRLSVTASIIWAPIMVLSIAGLPRTWTKVEW